MNAIKVPPRAVKCVLVAFMRFLHVFEAHECSVYYSLPCSIGLCSQIFIRNYNIDIDVMMAVSFGKK